MLSLPLPFLNLQVHQVKCEFIRELPSICSYSKISKTKITAWAREKLFHRVAKFRCIETPLGEGASLRVRCSGGYEIRRAAQISIPTLIKIQTHSRFYRTRLKLGEFPIPAVISRKFKLHSFSFLTRFFSPFSSLIVAPTIH